MTHEEIDAVIASVLPLEPVFFKQISSLFLSGAPKEELGKFADEALKLIYQDRVSK